MGSPKSTWCSKYSRICPSQPRNFKNFGGGSIGCLKITKDKSSKSRVQTPDAELIIATTTTPRRKGRNPRRSLTVVASLQYQEARVKTRVSTLPQWPGRRAHAHTKLDADPRARAHTKLDISTKGKVQALSQRLNASRVLTTGEPCVSIITALITG